MADPHHGVRFFQNDTDVQPVVDATMTKIGLVGTAPDADGTLWPEDAPVHLFTDETDKIAALGQAGTLQNQIDAITDQGVRAELVIIRSPEGADAEGTLSNIIGSAASKTGLHGLEYAQSEFGMTPSLLLAPGFTSLRPGDNANPVIAEMLAIATRLQAVMVADGPGTDRDGALEHRGDFNSDRLILVDPHVKVFRNGETIIEPAAARIAGMGIKRDQAKGGPFHSWSNQSVLGITGTSRPITFYLSDPACEANYLGQNQISTIFREAGEVTGGNGGFTFWGNQSATDDKLWRFYNVRRGRDFIHRSLAPALRPFLGRENIEPHAITALYDTMKSFLAEQQAKNNILGFDLGFNPGVNTAEKLRLGVLEIEFYAEESAPIEDLRVQSHRYRVAYDDLINDIKQFTG